MTRPLVQGSYATFRTFSLKPTVTVPSLCSISGRRISEGFSIASATALASVRSTVSEAGRPRQV